MRAALFAIALSSTCAAVFACGKTSSPDPDLTDAGNVAPPYDAGVEDAQTDGPVSPQGCPLKTTDYLIGAKAENLPRTDIAGAVNWTNVKGALSEDGDFATVTLKDGQESAELRIGQFPIKLPETVETWGIEVELKRTAPQGGIEDSKVDLIIAGKQTIFKYLHGPWPTKIVGTHHYGQAIDTWGVDLEPKDVNSSTFAAKLLVKKQADAGSGPVTANVDSIKVAVWYCPK